MSVRLSEAPSCESPLGAYDFCDRTGRELPRFASIQDAGFNKSLKETEPFGVRSLCASKEIDVRLGRFPRLPDPVLE